MGIHGLNNAINMAALWRTMKSGQPTKAAAPSQPTELTKNGSIFNSQNSQNTQNTQSQTTLNSQPGSSGFSIGEGKAQTANAKSMSAQAKAGKAEAERNSSIMGKISAQSKGLQQSTLTSQKAMQTAMKEGQEKIDQNNSKMQKLTANIMKEKAEIDAIQTRLESLTGGSGVGPHNSVYSLKLAGEEDPFGSGQVNGSGGGGGSNDSEIESLTAKLGSKAAKITVYSGQINKIQTSTGKAIHSMSKASHNYQKTVKQNQVQTQKNQAQLNNTYQTIDTINMIAQGTMLVGQMVEGFGQGMRAMGEKMVASQNPATASAGAALIVASVPIEETGNVTKTIGAYASTAVSVTKGVCQMADGDIGGAMQSIMAATTTVAAAIEGTKTMQSGFEGIKNDAQSAMQTGLEKQAAKAIYKENKAAMKEAGFSKSQIKQMANEQTAGKMKGADMNDIRDQLKANKNGEKGSHIGMAANMINEGNTNMQNTLNNLNGSLGNDKDIAKTIKGSQSSAQKALTSLKAIGMSFAAAGTIAGIVTAFTQSSSTPNVGKKERHREGKPINIDVNHSYMKELAHRKRMARAEAAEHRRG